VSNQANLLSRLLSFCKRFLNIAVIKFGALVADAICLAIILREVWK